MILEDKSILMTCRRGSFAKKFTEKILYNYYVKKLIIFSGDDL